MQTTSTKQTVKELIDAIGYDNLLRVIAECANDNADLHAGPGGSRSCRTAFNKTSGCIALAADVVESFLTDRR